MKVYIVCITNHKHVCALRAFASKRKAIEIALDCYVYYVKNCGAAGEQVHNNLIKMAGALADGCDYFDEDLNYTYTVREDYVKIENN